MFTTIRFRLTVWYALLLLLILLVLGLSFSWFLQRELYRDVDARLARTAQEIARQSQVVADPMTGDLSTIVPQALFRSPSQYIQAVQPDGQIGVSSQNLYGKKLPVAQLEPGERTPAYKTIELDGVRIRTLTLPIYLQSNNQALGTINVGESLSQVDRTLSSVRRLLLAGGAGGIALAALAGFLLAGRALRPVDRITATAAAIAAGTRPQRLQTERLTVSKHADELARLSATFNAMLDRLAETFATQRRFVSDASHELRTPLTALRGNIDVLSRQAEAGALTPEDVTATLDDLRRESRRMSRLVEDLLVLARTEELGPALPVGRGRRAEERYVSRRNGATSRSFRRRSRSTSSADDATMSCARRCGNEPSFTPSSGAVRPL